MGPKNKEVECMICGKKSTNVNWETNEDNTSICDECYEKNLREQGFDDIKKAIREATNGE